MTKWWQELPFSKKLLYTSIVSTTGGGAIGAFTAQRPIVGLGAGALIGFMLWGMGWTVYSGYRAVQAGESVVDTVKKLPGV